MKKVAKKKIKSIKRGDIVRLEYTKHNSICYLVCLIIDIDVKQLSIEILEIFNSSNSFINDNFIKLNSVGFNSSFSIKNTVLSSAIGEDEILQYSPKELKGVAKKKIPHMFI